MLMEARDAETFEGMDDRQLLDEALTLMVAGHETTANTLAWAWFCLARHPEVRAQMEDEIDRVTGGRRPGLNDVPHFVFTRQIVEETLRLFPPIWIIGREALDDDVLGGYDIAARSSLAIPPFLVHRHPAYWNAPDRFVPDRFAPENAAKRPKFAYFPFGGGQRFCLGAGLTLLQGPLILATLGQQFHFVARPDFNAQPRATIAVWPANGLPLKVKRKKAKGKNGRDTP